MEIKDLITYTKEYPAREAIYSDFPEDMLPELSAYLKNRGFRDCTAIRRKCLKKRRKGRIL